MPASIGDINTTMQTYMQAFRPTSSMSANRFDEGYSEDTRSQSGSDTVIRTDSRLAQGFPRDLDPLYPLPDVVLAMNLRDRSGSSHNL